MKKSITFLLAALTAFLLIGCTSPILPGGGGMSGTNDSGTVQFSWSSPGQANNSRSSFSRNVVATGNNIQDAKKVVITVEAADGTVVYSQKQLTLFNFNGSFLSEPLSLKVGSYKLTEYLLLNEAGTVIYATPKEGSAKAHLVADPLPINFTVAKDAATNIKPEVVDAADVTPADFGYATFSFSEVKVFNFLVSVMVYDATADNFVLTDATLDVTTDAKAYSFNLAPVTNNVAVNEMSGTYTLTITKAGYETHKVSHTAAELKAFFQPPLIVVLTKSQAPVDKIITFADPNLEAAVRTAISKPTGDIYKSDVAALTRLGATGKPIAGLGGIEELTSLTYLSLQRSSLTDISALSALTSLTDLYLGQNSITDINPLAKLTNLTTLEIRDNQIGDISALAAMTKLTKLFSGNNSISDLTPLSGLTNLSYLNSGDSSISDLSPLSGLTKLTEIYLTGNSIADIAPLSTLTNLEYLGLSKNKVANLAPLSGLNRLLYLNLRENLVTDITPLSTLTMLEELHLYINTVSDLTPLSSLANLAYINLGSNSVTDLSPLVSNSGIGSGDTISLTANPLSADAKSVQIPALQARGINVSF